MALSNSEKLALGAAAALAFSQSGSGDPGGDDPPANQQPSAAFTFDTSGLTVTLDGSTSADPDGTINTYDWTLTDPNGGTDTQTGSTVNFTATTAGTWEATLTVTDNDGGRSTETRTFTLTDPNESPTARINVSTSGTTATLDGSPSSDPDGTITDYNWQILGPNGESISRSGQVVEFTGGTGGTWEATLTVTDDAGATGVVTRTFGLADPNSGPTARISVSTDGLTATLDGTQSTDPDGSLVAYMWTLTDPNGASREQMGDVFDFTATTPGEWQADLTVQDDNGATDTASRTFTLQDPNESPTAAFSMSADTVEVGETLALYDEASDPDGNIVSREWNVCGSTFQGGTQQVSFQSTGECQITFTVTDDDGATVTSDPQTVTVIEPEPEPPQAGFSWSASGGDPYTLTVESTSYDPDGSITDTYIAVQTAGGSSTVDDTNSESLSTQVPIYGSWNVVVEVTDDDGETSRVEELVDVPQSGTQGGQVGASGNDDGGNGGGDLNEPPNASFDVTNNDPEFTFESTASDPNGSIDSYSWEIVHADTGEFEFGAVGQTETYTFVDNGEYTVYHEVSDDQGASDTASQRIEVTEGSDNVITDPPDSFDREFRVQNLGDIGETLYCDFNTTGYLSIQDPGGTDTELPPGPNSPAEASMNIPSGEERVVRFNGEIVGFGFENTPPRTWVDGLEVNPYELGTNLSEKRWPGILWTDGDARGGQVVEIAFYVSRDLFDQYGRTPARACAEWLSTMFRDKGLNHRIWTMTAPLDAPNKAATCCNPMRGDLECCGPENPDDFADCPPEMRIPGAKFWFEDALKDTGLMDEWEADDQLNPEDRTIITDADRNFANIEAKDSNIILTTAPFGGCADIGGNTGAVGANALSEVREYVGADSDDYTNQIHNVAHEVGHNLGLVHAGDPPGGGTGQGGMGRWDHSAKTWIRTPTVGCNDCVNRCGEYIEYNPNIGEVHLGDLITEKTTMYDMEYTECDVQGFLIRDGATSGTFTGVHTDVSGDCCSYSSQMCECGSDCDC
jgi:hypothetical protein